MDDVFAEVYATLRRKPEPSLEPQEEYRKGLENFQTEFLSKHFRRGIPIDLREGAKRLKEVWELRREDLSSSALAPARAKRYAQDTTLQSLVNRSRELQEQFEIKAGQSLPESPEQTANQMNATFWGQIAQIAREAAGIKD